MIFDIIEEFVQKIPTREAAKKVFEQIDAGKGQLSVKQIAEKVNKNQTDVSMLLTLLVNAGFITYEKQGKNRYYRVHPQIQQKETLLRQFLQPHDES